MKNFSREDAISCIKSFNTPVDGGVYESLLNFMVIANRLGAVTIESCHGHVDWIFSYPNISFGIAHKPLHKAPFWNVLALYKRHQDKKEVESTLERRVEDIIFFLTREIIQFHQDDKTDPHLLFSVIRTKGFSFRVVAAFPDYSRGLRSSGMFEELEDLMVKQRLVLKKLSERVLERVEAITSFGGIGRCGCSVCRIKH